MTGAVTLAAAAVLASSAVAGCGSSQPGDAPDAGSEGGSSSVAGGAADAGFHAGLDAGTTGEAAGDSPATSPLTVSIQCSTAAVVGLEWNAVPGATHYSVSRDGTPLGTTAMIAFADQTVDPKTSYTYAVAALDSTGATRTSATVGTTNAAASPDGDAPYCPSSLVKSATWNWSTGFDQQNGSDLWPSTWGADGDTYFFFGDGGGFFGSNSAGRASFGIARVTGAAPVVDGSDASNVYGGYQASHPSTIDGKAGSIIAVGSDFYALGGIYGADDTGGPSGSPNHYEIISSTGNAYSWVDSPWRFCAADASGNPTQGTYCAVGFVNFGAGNAGAFDDDVYMVAAPVAGWFGGSPPPGPANTYMMRAPSTMLTTQSAYSYYAGLDATGQPVWSQDDAAARPIFSDRNTRPMGIGIVYNPGLQRFIASAQGAVVAEEALYESEHPWGPWYTIGYENTDPGGLGGWGDLGSSYTAGSGDSLGINFVQAWTSGDGLTMWATFSSDGNAPGTALLPGLARQPMDSFNLVSVTFTE